MPLQKKQNPRMIRLPHDLEWRPPLGAAIRNLAANPHSPEAYGNLIEEALANDAPELALMTMQCAYLDKLAWCLNTIIKDGITRNDTKKGV